MQRLTKEQSAIITAYTKILVGPFSVFHEYAEEKLGRSILTREFASKEIWAELKKSRNPI